MHLYQSAVQGIGGQAEFIPKPEVEMIPGEYLYSENVYHEHDTLWPLYIDNDEKRNWRIFPLLLKFDKTIL